MRAWFLSDPEQECTAAILQELGACVGPAKEALATTGMEAVVGETMELSEEHLGAAFAETVKVSLGSGRCGKMWIGSGNIMTSPPHSCINANASASDKGSSKPGRCREKYSKHPLPVTFVSPLTDSSPNSPNPPIIAQELGREHCLQDSNGQEYFYLSDGRVYIDVRDSADAWIRIALSKKDALILPNGMWRRLVLPSEEPYVVLERRTKSSSSSTSGSSSSTSNGKESHFVKIYRFSSRDDEQRLASLRKEEAGKEGGGMQQLIVDLCRQFYELGWVTGTGGSISIRHGNRVYMTPSGVQKERILPEELYVLDMR